MKIFIYKVFFVCGYIFDLERIMVVNIDVNVCLWVNSKYLGGYVFKLLIYLYV